MDGIHVGSIVEYISPFREGVFRGKVILIAKIEESKQQNLIGKKFCDVEYDPRCYVDRILIDDLKLID